MSCFFLLYLGAYAQKKIERSGHVQEAKGDPVSGATIEDVKGHVLGQTDSKGNFTVSVSDTVSRIKVTYAGYMALVVPIGKLGNIVLSQGKSPMDEVIVMGYGSQTRKKVTGSVAILDGDAIKNTPEVSFDAMLEGRVAGISIQSSSGEPGAKSNVIIRGTTNVDYGNANGGNTQPLYVIDGVIFDVNNIQGAYALSNPLSLINPNDIESIEVLKDASAAAIYGARGGNGVIIVKTRRALSKRPLVTFNTYAGATTAPRLMDVITGNAERTLKMRLLASQLGYTDIANDGIPIQLTDSLNPAFNNDVDWQSMLIRKNALVNNQDLSVSGAFDNRNSYRIGLNHYDEQGAVKGFGADRIAPNFDLQLNPAPKFSVGFTLQMSQEKRHHGAGTNGNPFSFTSNNFPTSLAQMSASTMSYYNGTSNRYDDNNIFLYNGSIRLTDSVAKHLTVSTTYSLNNSIDKYAYFSPVELNGIQNEAFDITASNPNWASESLVTYYNHFGDHTLTLIGGFSAYNAKQYYNYSEAAGINVSGIYTLQTVAPGANLTVNTTNAFKNTESYYGQVGYDYKSKYLFQALFRRDASSIYSSDYRWGTFYAFSAGWNVSDEDFFQPLKKVVNALKIRGSYGVTGQDPGSWYAKYQQLYTDASGYGSTTGAVYGSALYAYLGGVPATYNGTTVVSPYPYGNNYSNYGAQSSNSVHWEKYPQLDLGADWSMFNSRLNFVVDYYQKDSKGKYLWLIPAETTTGYQYYSGNYADLTNRGVEVAVNANVLGPKSPFQWNTSFNIAFNKGWVSNLPNGGQDLLYGESWWQKTLSRGEPIFTYRDYITKGVFATDADVPTDPITGKKMTYFGTTLHAGDSRIVDQNGDYNIDLNDKVNTGKSAAPKVTGGFTNTFSYKGFSLSVFVNYSFGNYLINGTFSDALNGSPYSSWGAVAGPAGIYSSSLSQFWSQPGQSTTYPRLVYGTGSTSQDPWNVARDYFLSDGGYIKIQQVTVGYTVPGKISSRLNLRSLRFYGSVNNLHTFKRSKSLVDPTVYDYTTGSSNTTYPTGVKIIGGLSVDL
ncbi:MAG TPA: SusC/RagA family TonB-linked outer membrane protein [Puia sp.]|nr:SusC/RagA family TonB-linked outer membrane protein [Puia sp.]